MSIPGLSTIITTKGPVVSEEYFEDGEECDKCGGSGIICDPNKFGEPDETTLRQCDCGEQRLSDGSLIGEDEP
jgi:hypothetical protein